MAQDMQPSCTDSLILSAVNPLIFSAVNHCAEKLNISYPVEGQISMQVLW